MRPNIVFIMADDHAAHAVGAYGSKINETPHIDRIAAGGALLENCFCTNSLCAPSRATILTGTYNHVNGVQTLSTEFDNRQLVFPELLRRAGYQTALVGKWHLGHGPEHDPRGFDYWEVVPGQGRYRDPVFIGMDGTEQVRPGYCTNIITDLAVDWLDQRDQQRPFCLLVHHKAPHRNWEPDDKHRDMYVDDVAVPGSFDDDHSGHAAAARAARMRVDRDLTANDIKEMLPPHLDPDEAALWTYQRYIKDYLRCVASVDDNVGRLLDYLDEHGLTDDTIVVYTSDQGFFLGDHGWYDKRFMYEESLRMPFLIRYPAEIPAGSTTGALAMNVDFAQTFLDYAGVPADGRMQGRSLRPLLRGEAVDDWRQSVYYRYWEHDDDEHHVWAHYGVRTHDHKLVYYYADGLGLPGTSATAQEPEWELFDLRADPWEMRSVYDDPAYARIRTALTDELARVQRECGDTPWQPQAAVTG
ncbi:sulfatase [Micromonospora parva]|uniref:sulfatase family protein n=1 Tax=Micromonospora TaxID=1873 RepID=UPI000A8F2D55|nr:MULTISPECIES: sulfatase [Micromonospora]MBQ1031394.1 sulfatase [Micromonospora sp. C97]